jgi:hypothetical protein
MFFGMIFIFLGVAFLVQIWTTSFLWKYSPDFLYYKIEKEKDPNIPHPPPTTKPNIALAINLGKKKRGERGGS